MTSLHTLVDRQDGSIFVWAQYPRECVQCRRLTVFFVSRNGRTVCFWCDDEEQRKKAAA